MVFSSTIFLFLFLPILLVVYYNPIIKNKSFKNVVLLFGSIFFYAWGEPVFVFLILISVFVNWLSGLLIYRTLHTVWSKIWLIVNLCWNIGLLFVFKYLQFIAENLGLLLYDDSAHFGIEIALPIGISFFTFQIMSYTIDVYRKRVPVQKNILYLGMYILMFPQLVAGPIVRYETVADEILNRKETSEDFTSGVSRFVFGLGKKVLIANYVGRIADFVWGADEKTVVLAWIGAIAYTLQIYFDFAGYSDMAIGLGRMFGFHYDENFNYPYISKSITEFWRRWHMSLSQWFRDYVYIPLGGNRVSESRNYLNLFVVWLLTGIWHGANWTFVVWGLGYFVLLVIEKKMGTIKIKGLSNVYTMFFVILLWVLFRADSLAQAGYYIGAMFGIGSVGILGDAAKAFLSHNILLFTVAIVGCLPVVPMLKKKMSDRCVEWISALSMVAIFVLCIMSLVTTDYNPFIYFNF